MKNHNIIGVFCAIASISILHGANTVDCPRQSLQKEIDKAKPGETIRFTGVCTEALVLQADNITLQGVGSAAVDGRGSDALLVAGAHGVALSNFEVRNGRNGIVGQNGAHFALNGITAKNNIVHGISLQTASSAILTNSSVTDNGLHGLALETGSAATITGQFSSLRNRVFGVNVNGSSLTFSQATANLSSNALGMQVATSANAFLNDAQTAIQLTNNLATGLTVVSGAHMVSFGGTITATGNGAFGVSVNSKGGLDLDAGSVLTASNNRAGGLAVQQDSVMTVFNNPQFSGAPGFSTITASGNLGNGIAVLTGSTLTLANQAQITSTGNNAFGLLADNGSGVTLRNTTLTGNRVRDLQLTFGARADVQVNFNAATVGCDATVLVRGASFTCAN